MLATHRLAPLPRAWVLGHVCLLVMLGVLPYCDARRCLQCGLSLARPVASGLGAWPRRPSGLSWWTGVSTLLVDGLSLASPRCLGPGCLAWLLSMQCWWTGASTRLAGACSSPVAPGLGGCCCLTARAPSLHGPACRRPLCGPSSSAASADNWLSLVAQTARSSLLPRPLGRFNTLTNAC